MEVTIVARLNGESRHIKIIKFNFKVRLCGIHKNINTLLSWKHIEDLHQYPRNHSCCCNHINILILQTLNCQSSKMIHLSAIQQHLIWFFCLLNFLPYQYAIFNRVSFQWPSIVLFVLILIKFWVSQHNLQWIFLPCFSFE